MKDQSDFGYFQKGPFKILNKVKHEARERQTLGKANQIVGYFQKGVRIIMYCFLVNPKISV